MWYSPAQYQTINTKIRHSAGLAHAKPCEVTLTDLTNQGAFLCTQQSGTFTLCFGENMGFHPFLS